MAGDSRVPSRGCLSVRGGSVPCFSPARRRCRRESESSGAYRLDVGTPIYRYKYTYIYIYAYICKRCMCIYTPHRRPTEEWRTSASCAPSLYSPPSPPAALLFPSAWFLRLCNCIYALLFLPHARESLVEPRCSTAPRRAGMTSCTPVHRLQEPRTQRSTVQSKVDDERLLESVGRLSFFLSLSLSPSLGFSFSFIHFFVFLRSTTGGI